MASSIRRGPIPEPEARVPSLRDSGNIHEIDQRRRPSSPARAASAGCLHGLSCRPGAAGFAALDLSRPIAVTMHAILHFFTDDEAERAIATLTGPLCPGSALSLSIKP
jgi:hypothetical protein